MSAELRKASAGLAGEGRTSPPGSGQLRGGRRGEEKVGTERAAGGARQLPRSCPGGPLQRWVSSGFSLKAG